MQPSFRIIFAGCVALVALAGPGRAAIINNRWARTATNGTVVGSNGTSITVTWSLAPNGTFVPNDTGGMVASNLISFLDTNFGAGPGGSDFTQRPWFPIVGQAHSRISELSGLIYVYEPKDDAQSFGNTNAARGVLGIRGDTRLGGRSYGAGSNTLASNFYPSYSEMMVNTDQAGYLRNSFANYRTFRNVLMHESMHGLGVAHVESSNASLLMEPFIDATFDGPQLDDVLALQRLYGDVYEKNGDNNSYQRATSLGQLDLSTPLARGTLGDSTVVLANETDFLSISGTADTDFFSFVVPSRMDVSLQLTPRGATYQMGSQTGDPSTQSSYNALTLNNLNLALFDTNGTSLITSANANGAGLGEQISRLLMPGTYYVRVQGGQDDVQLYGVNLASTLPAARNLVWTGSLSANWDLATTANFKEGAASTVFYLFDHATFNDTATTKTVNLPANISAGNIRVTTTTEYTFSGPGRIVAGSLTVDGAGVVTLSNSGNSFAGQTQVLAGTLAITGDANAMTTPIRVAAGGKLLMNATDAAAMSSTFNIESGGVLQIGTLASTANVFPDAPGQILNEGTIRVLDEESLSHVSGNGQIVAESETVHLLANPGFHGEMHVKQGAVGSVENNDALGSSLGKTIVDDGGALVIAADSVLADEIWLAGNGGGNGSLQVASALTANLLGNLVVTSPATLIRVDAGAQAALQGKITAKTPPARVTLHVAAGGLATMHGQVSLGEGGVTKEGPGVAEFHNLDYTGDTIIHAGTARLVDAPSLAGKFQIDTGATLELGGTNTFLPTSRIFGSGNVSGNLTMPGAIAPGPATAVLNFAGQLTLTDVSHLMIELNGPTKGSGYDALQINGIASLSGSLDVSLLSAFTPFDQESFEILHADAGISGQFITTNLPPVSDFTWKVIYGDTSVLLTLSPVQIITLVGDFNKDGSVDAADYTVWRNTLGQTGAGLAADANGDHEITTLDYDLWKSHYGEMAAIGPALPTSQSVPEPAASALLAAAALAALICRANAKPHRVKS